MNPKRPFFDGIVRDERGAAVAMILLIGSVLVVLTGVIVTRGVRQMGNTAGDADWEQALNVAEAGMEYAINEKNAPFGYSTGETVPSFADRSEERDWVLAEAALNPVIATPEGEFTVIVPEFQQVLYSVGYVPARGADGVRTRVVRRDYTVIRFSTIDGLLVGGDAEIEANAVINDPVAEGAHVHANGTLTVGNNVLIDGCATSSESIIPADGDCPESPIAPAWMPTVRVRPYYQYATHVMCPDGTIRGGPASTSKPDPTPDTPCDPGDQIVLDTKWQYSASGNSWSAKKDDVSGVFYFYATDFVGKIGKEPTGKMVEATLIAESASHSCLAPTGGNIELSSGSYIHYHSSGAQYQTAIIAEGDVKYRGGATVIGAVIAREQVDYRGSPDSWGPVVASDECDTPGSPVSSTVVTGGATITFSGELETLFLAGILPVNWDEL
jgi:hypothetical protein